MTTNPTPENTTTDPSVVEAPAKKSKVRRNLILAGSAAGLVGIGSTLAANINLNSGENVEFGQGVARTTACDEDGFTINPVTSYDNEHSIFRLDYVEVTGLNLTPEGTGYNSGGYNSQADAIAAHPGEYYDNGWKRTCDGVVLDFKAYTDDTTYWTATRDGYSFDSTNNISTPIGWAQANGNVGQTGNNDIQNFGFSVKFDTSDDNNSESSDYGVSNDSNSDWAAPWLTDWGNLNHTNPANSSFIFGVLNNSFNANHPNYNVDMRPDAASISKITVASMASFASNYYLASQA
jgi:hypothetical protein